MLKTRGIPHMNSTARRVNSFSITRDGEVVCITQSKTLLRDSSCCHNWRVSSTGDKEQVISQLEQLLSGEDEAHSFLRQRALLMADEMLENALFAAPRDCHDKPLYARGDRRSLLPGEHIMLCSYYDGDTLTLEVTDTWGSLSPETVRVYLDMNLAENDPTYDRTGRGLYFMWRFLQNFYLSVVPGVETTVGGFLQLHPTINN
jgi:hypothetical protein